MLFTILCFAIFPIKRKNMQISKFVLGFQAQLYMETVETNIYQYIMIYISFIYGYICYFSKFD